MNSSPTSQSFAEKDSCYECDAPNYYSFNSGSQCQTPSMADKWFEGKQETPLSQRSNEPSEPLYDPNMDSQTLSSADEESILFDQTLHEIVPEDPLATPKASWFDKMKNQKIADEQPSKNDILDENTPTPRPVRTRMPEQQSTAMQSTVMVNEQQQEEEEEDEDEHVQKRFANLRVTAYTPMKGRHGPSKLSQEVSFVPHEEDEEEVTPETVKKSAVKFVKAAFVPARSTKPLTMPVEFKFSSRLDEKRKQAAVLKTEKPKETTISLVKKTVTAGKRKNTTKPLTVSKASGNLQHGMKNYSRYENAGMVKSPYIPLAVRVNSFNKTPDRFKTKPAPKPPVLVKAKPQVTRPVSPKFATASRIKKEPILTTEEKILLEMKNMAPFKARPVNHRILNSAGDLGVPRVKKAHVTVAHSPKITKNKIVEPVKPASPPRLIKANPFLPPKAFVPKIEHRIIKPSNFKLPGEDLSERKKMELEEKKLEEETKLEQQRQFRANPMFVAYAEPQCDVIRTALVDPKSPLLQTKIRGNAHIIELEKRLQEEEAARKRAAEFHAQPVPCVEPFVPKKSEKPLTENVPIHLNTGMRADERKQFEEGLKQREMDIEAMKHQQEKEEEERQKLEIQRLREKTRFHAKPVKHTIPFEPKKSDKPLTEPISPFIGEKRRHFAKHR